MTQPKYIKPYATNSMLDVLRTQALFPAKRSFFRSFNGIFGRVGRIASNEVIVQLVKSKCFPVLFYGLAARPLRISPLTMSLTAHLGKFSIGRNRSQETVDLCLEMVNCLQAEQTIAIRKRKFLNKFSVVNNVSCHVFVVSAKKELESCCTDV